MIILETLKKIKIEIDIETKQDKTTKIKELYNEIKTIKAANPDKYSENKYMKVILSFAFLVVGLSVSVTLHMLSYLVDSFNFPLYPLLGFTASTILFSLFYMDIFKEIKKNDKTNNLLSGKINNYTKECFEEDEKIYGSKITTLKFEGGFNDEIKYQVKKEEYVHSIDFLKKSNKLHNVYTTKNIIGFIEDIENSPDETIIKVRTLNTDFDVFENI